MIDSCRLNPYVRIALDSVIPAGGRIETRIIYDYELIGIRDGTFTFTYDGRAYPCRAGDFLLIHPNVPHSFTHLIGDLSQPHVHFDFYYEADSPGIPVSFKNRDAFSREELRHIREDVLGGYTDTPFLRFSQPETVAALLQEVIRASEKDPIGQKAAMLQLIRWVLRENFPEALAGSPVPGGNISRSVREYLGTREGMTAGLDDLEMLFSYSKFYLEHRFKADYGVSLIRFRNGLRLEEARRLLRERSVSEAARELGYSSVHAFSRAFRRYFGECPTQSAGRGPERAEKRREKP